MRVSFYWLSSNLWGCDGYCCMSIWLNSKIFPADKEIFYGTSPRCCWYNDVNCLKECIVSLFSDNADQQVGLCHSSIRTWRYFTSDLLWNIFLCNKEKKSFFTVWIHQNGQIEIMTFLACLFDANQLLLLTFCSQASHFWIIQTFMVPYHHFFTV